MIRVYALCTGYIELDRASMVSDLAPGQPWTVAEAAPGAWHPWYMKDPVRLLRRIAITIVGTVILAVGVVLLVAPGPGLLVIFLALLVFAVEYEWARRRLREAKKVALTAAQKTATNRVAKASALEWSDPSPAATPFSRHSAPCDGMETLVAMESRCHDRPLPQRRSRA